MPTSTLTTIIPTEVISQKIFIIRGVKVMLDFDLAEIYQVTTKVLNQAVKRNIARFPPDFVFKLSNREKTEVVTNCDHLSNLRFSHQQPYAFTEHGVSMLSAVLKSARAIQMSVFIVRAFIKLREMLATHKDLANKIEELENRQLKQGEQILVIHRILKQLIERPVEMHRIIGFTGN